MPTTSSGWRASSKRPKILLDRSLSSRLAPVLKLALIDCLTLEDVYGRAGAEQAPDVQWIEDAARHGYAVFTANPRILSVKLEREAIEAHGTKVFCIAKPDGTRETRAYIYGRHILSIMRRMKKPGPCFWRLYAGQRPTSYDIN